jgi:hypothetical protein
MTDTFSRSTSHRCRPIVRPVPTVTLKTSAASSIDRLVCDIFTQSLTQNQVTRLRVIARLGREPPICRSRLSNVGLARGLYIDSGQPSTLFVPIHSSPEGAQAYWFAIIMFGGRLRHGKSILEFEDLISCDVIVLKFVSLLSTPKSLSAFSAFFWLVASLSCTTS